MSAPTLTVLLLSLLLTACGGGDQPEQPDAPTPAVNCQTRPELCQ